MEKTNVKVNYIYNLTYQLLLLITPLITTPYLSRVLCTDGIGRFGYTQSIVMYFSICGSLGTNLYGQREIAYHQNDIKERSRVFYEVFCLKAITLIISCIIYYNTLASYGDYAYLFKIQCIDLLSAIFDIAWFFQGLELFKKTVTRNIVIKFISIILIYVFIKQPSDLIKFYYIHALTLIVSNLSLWAYLPKLIVKQRIRIFKAFLRIPALISLFIPQAAIQIYSLLDKTMIGIITDSTFEVANYEQSQKLVNLCITLVSSLTTVMLPRLASVYKKQDKEKINFYMKRTFEISLFLALPLTIGLQATISNITPWFFSSEFSKVNMNVWTISPIITLTCISTILGKQYMVATCNHRKYTFSIIIGAVSSVILNYIFINLFLSIGAAIASVTSAFIIMMIDILLLRKELNFSQLLKPFIKYLSISIIMGVIVAVVGTISTNAIVNSLVQILCGVLVYFILLVIIKDKILLEGVQFVSRIITKRLKRTSSVNI